MPTTPDDSIDAHTEPPRAEQFLFVSCQAGAKDAVKREVATLLPTSRLAYSRGGFLTFKLTDADCPSEDLLSQSVFVRARGRSLGRAQGDSDRARSESVWQLAQGMAIDRIHVWQRDRRRTVQSTCWTDPNDVTQAVYRSIGEARPSDQPRQEQTPEACEAMAGDRVLDCILITEQEWWIGCHLARNDFSRWPGWVPAVDVPPECASRAYRKMVEGLLWSGLPIRPGDRCAEIGSAPGGGAQALLDRGLHVMAIDPAKLNEKVIAHPRLVHVRKRCREVRRREFRKVRWLMADLNVAPKHTLDTVDAIVTHSDVRVRGLLLTLKLSDWNLAMNLPEYLDRVRGWGYSDVRAWQLPHNGQELCITAQ